MLGAEFATKGEAQSQGLKLLQFSVLGNGKKPNYGAEFATKGEAQSQGLKVIQFSVLGNGNKPDDGG